MPLYTPQLVGSLLSGLSTQLEVLGAAQQACSAQWVLCLLVMRLAAEKTDFVFWRRKQRKELDCQFPIICQQVRLVEIFLSQQCDLLSGAHLASLPQSRADGPLVVYPLSDD